MVKISRDDSADLQAWMMGCDNALPIESLEEAIKTGAFVGGEVEGMDIR